MGSSNSAAGLILLGLGVMLMLLYVTGQLEWLFRLAAQVNDARPPAVTPPPPADPTPTGPTATAAIGPRPRSPSLRAVA